MPAPTTDPEGEVRGGAMPTMTVVISTYNRRALVLRLLAALAPQLSGAAGGGVDVLVVVDGSTDGTHDAVEHLDYPVPLRVTTQQNTGLAAARNRGLREARGDVVFFIDDDMVPSDRLVWHHRRAHRRGPARLVAGPCPHPPAGADVALTIRAYYEERFARLAKAGEISAAPDFTAANTSGPAGLWRAVGGFEERLQGWGMEDQEICMRLLEAHIPIAFEPKAVAWHHQTRTVGQFCAETRNHGRNLVRVASLHPDALDDLIPVEANGRVLSVVHRLCGDDPRGWDLAAAGLTALAKLEHRAFGHRRARILRLAEVASRIAGVAELSSGRGYVVRYFAPLRRP